MRGDFDGILTFMAVADTLSFRRAAERLGVTHSAVSQSVQRLEARLGVVLLRRTTRSVHLTDAGSALADAARVGLAQLNDALVAAREADGQLSGSLRLAVSSVAESFLDGAVLASFMTAYPRINLDLTVTDDEFDIVSRGYDAGVRLGEIIEADMIAVPVSGDQRQLAVAAPAYLASAGRPRHPRDLAGHHCIGWRKSPEVAPYQWEFTDTGKDFTVSVGPRITTNDMTVMIRLACAGVGITVGLEDTFRPFLDDGRLVSVLDEFSLPFSGFFLYYPSRRVSSTLRALIQHLRENRSKQSKHGDTRHSRRIPIK